MNPKPFLWLLKAILVVFIQHAEAQPPTKAARIGHLAPDSASALGARMDAFRQGLRELGYVDGKNIVIERRHADGKLDRLPAIATELVHLNIAVIVTGGSASTHAAQQTTSTIPIVMPQDPDPIDSGFIISLARPGGNITGLCNLVSDLRGKRLALLRRSFPDSPV
jgi:putative ABC transport system substrate-binding protein